MIMMVLVTDDDVNDWCTIHFRSSDSVCMVDWYNNLMPHSMANFH